MQRFNCLQLFYKSKMISFFLLKFSKKKERAKEKERCARARACVYRLGHGMDE